MSDDKISKEEKFVTNKLNAHYEETKYCRGCHIKLPVSHKYNEQKIKYTECPFCGKINY